MIFFNKVITLYAFHIINQEELPLCTVKTINIINYDFISFETNMNNMKVS